MSNIDSLRRTESSHLSENRWTGLSASQIPTLIASLILAVLLISFRPFNPAGGGAAGGDLVNQVGFTAVALLSLLGLCCFADRKLIPILFSPWWMALALLLLLSVSVSILPGQALRATIFTLIGILASCAVLVLPRTAENFSSMLAWVGLGVVAICYFGLIIYPGVAIHPYDAFEPGTEGAWRGLYAHKNIAGPVMACLSFASIYLMRRHWWLCGAVMFLGAFLFLVRTDSMTTTILAPITILAVIGPTLLGLRALVPLLFLLSTSFAAIATLGMVFFEPVKQILTRILPDPTYTGRVTIWEFAGDLIAKRPLTGYGLESVWTTSLVSDRLRPFDSAWDISGIVHGHNGYLDVALAIGIPGLVVALMAFLFVPSIDYLRTPSRRENVFLADFFMMIVMFTCLNAFLESFFFRRADPVWLLFVFGVMGLRVVARRPVSA